MNRRFIIMLLGAILAVVMAGCSDEEDCILNNPSEVVQKKTFRILCYGNSFTEDSMGYVPMILDNIASGVDVTIGIACSGGCSLQQHLANFTGEVFIDGETEYTPQRYAYFVSEGGAAWVSKGKKDARSILADKEWDVVTFQQKGSQAHLEWSEVIWPYVSRLVTIVEEETSGRVKCGWILTHGAYGASDAGFEMYWRGTADNARKTAEALDCVVFPYGTAVQNLRLTDLKSLGDGSAHNLTVDNGHLQEGIGCYTAALTNAITILHLAGEEEVDIMEDNTEISEASIRSMNVPGQHFGTGIIGMTPDNILVAKQAALAAIADPYNLTQPAATGLQQ